MSDRIAPLMLEFLEIQADLLERAGLSTEARSLATEVLACRLARLGH